MIVNRILRYVIVFLCVLLAVSLIVIYQYRGFLATYFTDSFSSAVGLGVYLLIYGAAFFMLIRAIVR